MSIRKRGNGWCVRWGNHRRQFTLKKDAQAFELELKRRRQLGALAPDILAPDITLRQFVLEEWLPNHAATQLKPSTQRRYGEIWTAHLDKQIGGLPLREITPAVVQDLAGQLHRRGLAAATQRKTLVLLQGILRRATVRGLISQNPVAVVDKPRTPANKRLEPLSPEQIERIRVRLGQRDATLISVLAYAGLRPGEATSARWQDLDGSTLHVHASKTERERWIDLPQPLVQDLQEWRLASGRPDRESLIFPKEQIPQSRKRKSVEWTRDDWNNWRGRVYQPAARSAGVTGDLRPYRLRSSCASLRLWAGEDLATVAEQDGHSIATLARHYAGVIRALSGKPRVPMDEAIRQARATVARMAERRPA